MRAGCVICGDLFTLGADVTATPCGHTFHSLCLLQWLERSKSCPQCRHIATLKTILKLYFDASGNEPSQLDPDALQNMCDNLMFQIKIKEQEHQNNKEETKTMKRHNVALREEVKSLSSKIRAQETAISTFTDQLKRMDRLCADAKAAREEVKTIKNKLNTFQNMETVLSGSIQDVDNILGDYNGSSDAKSIAMLASVLKRSLNKAVEDKKRLRDDLDSTKAKLKELRFEYIKTSNELTLNKTDVECLERENGHLKKKVIALQDAITSPSGDVKTGALHRLISESPAPQNLKRSSPSQEDFVTPEVIRKKTKTNHKMTLDSDDVEVVSFTPPVYDAGTPEQVKDKESPYLQLKSSSVNICAINRIPLSQTNNNTNIGNKLVRQNQGLFKKTKSLNYVVPSGSHGLSGRHRSSGSHGLSKSGNQIGYDGFGGHHKVNEFPKPRQPPLKLKTNVNIISKTNGKLQKNTIKDFFKNPFDDL